MRRKGRTAAAILFTGILFSSLPADPAAATDQTIVELDEISSEMEDFYSRYGYTQASAENAGSVLEGYEVYLNSTPAFQASIDSLWIVRQNPSGSIRELAYAAVDCINASEDFSEDVRQSLKVWADSLRVLDPELPEIVIPVQNPDPIEPDPDQPDPDDPDNPDNPDDKDDPDQPGDNEGQNPDDPNKPGDGEENKPGKPQDPENPIVPVKPSGPEQGTTDDTISKDPGSQQKPGSQDGQKPGSDTNQKDPSVPGDVATSRPNFTTITVKELSKTQNRKITISGLGEFNLLPDFSLSAAWKGSRSPYNTPSLWGQCTWFAWGRFYELYGFSPSFSGNGYQCVSQLIAAHPDKFRLSKVPAAGAVFSSDAAHNHVGIVLEYDASSKLLTIQEGNLDGVSNSNWNEAVQDYRTIKCTPEDMKAMYGNVTYAVPKGTTKVTAYTAYKSKKAASKQSTQGKVKTLRALAEEKLLCRTRNMADQQTDKDSDLQVQEMNIISGTTASASAEVNSESSTNKR